MAPLEAAAAALSVPGKGEASRPSHPAPLYHPLTKAYRLVDELPAWPPLLPSTEHTSRRCFDGK